MESRAEQAGGTERRREPDALDLWLARQRGAWWQRWWWALTLVTAAMLAEPVLRAAAGVPVLGWLGGVLRWYPSWLGLGGVYLPTRLLLALVSYVVVVSAVTALCLSVSRLPSELAVALPRRETYFRLIGATRLTALGVFAAVVLPAEALDCFVGGGAGSFSLISNSLMLMDRLLVGWLMIELSIWLVQRVGLRSLPAMVAAFAALAMLDELLLDWSAQLLLRWPGLYVRGVGWRCDVYWPFVVVMLLKLVAIALLWLDTRRGAARPVWER